MEISMGREHYLQSRKKSFKRCAILFNPKLDVCIGSSEADKNGRYLLLEASIFKSTFLFCNIYSPNDNNSQNAFFTKLSDSLRRHADMQIVMGGDFSCALTPLDKTGGTSTERKKIVINKIKKNCTQITTSKMCGDLNIPEHHNTHGAITR